MDNQPGRLPLLRRGAAGPAVFALREHLRALGHKFGSERDFGDRTEQAVFAFQTERGLRSDGICGPQTWAALLEAGFALGDRLVAVRRPLMRGDDVTALQLRLNALGFDPGRPDGIFGANTEAALRDFQRNAGLAQDGVCGPQTITALDRLDALAGGSVTEVREHEALRNAPRTIVGRRIAIHGADDEFGLCAMVANLLGDQGGEILLLIGTVSDATARAANDFHADLILSFSEPEPTKQRTSYFGTDKFKSVGGYSHAYHVARAIAGCLEPAEVAARTYQILRETEMAAVVLHLAEHEYRSIDLGVLSEAVANGVRIGFEADIALPPN